MINTERSARFIAAEASRAPLALDGSGVTSHRSLLALWSVSEADLFFPTAQRYSMLVGFACCLVHASSRSSSPPSPLLSSPVMQSNYLSFLFFLDKPIRVRRYCMCQICGCSREISARPATRKRGRPRAQCSLLLWFAWLPGWLAPRG
jgi:hypothetical protein